VDDVKRMQVVKALADLPEVMIGEKFIHVTGAALSVRRRLQLLLFQRLILHFGFSAISFKFFILALNTSISSLDFLFSSII